MAILATMAKQKPAKAPKFLAHALKKNGLGLAPLPVGKSPKALGTQAKGSLPSAPIVHVLPTAPSGPALKAGPGGVKVPSGLALKASVGPVKLPAKTPAHVVNLSAVRQESAINARQGIAAGGTARRAIVRNEIRTDRNAKIARLSPIVSKNPPSPTISLRTGRKLYTGAFSATRFTTPFQKNVNNRRMTGIY